MGSQKTSVYIFPSVLINGLCSSHLGRAFHCVTTKFHWILVKISWHIAPAFLRPIYWNIFDTRGKQHSFTRVRQYKPKESTANLRSVDGLPFKKKKLEFSTLCFLKMVLVFWICIGDWTHDFICIIKSVQHWYTSPGPHLPLLIHSEMKWLFIHAMSVLK